MSENAKEWIVAIIVGVLLAAVIRIFLLDVVYIKGESMLPTFQNKDVVLVEKLSYRFHKPKIGDVIIVPIPGDEKKIIKRVVGLPGDTIEVKEGHLYRDGKIIKENFIKEPMDPNSPYPKITVPKNHVFVMGDNRNNSSDSRLFEPFDINDIKGRVFFELYNNPFKLY